MESFKKNLETQTLEICGEKDHIRRDKIHVAPVEISTQPQNLKDLDKSGHFHYRQDIVRVYNKKPSDIISHEQIFEVAKQHAESSAKECSTDEAKAKHILKYSNLVFLSGQAGVGKSTLSKVLVQKMLAPDVCLYQTEFVFFIRFRDLDYHNKINLLQFLTNCASFISDIACKDIAKIIQRVKASHNHVYIVLDGLDEAGLDLSTKYPTCDAMSSSSATFIHHLLTGRLLPKSKKLVTSRPRQLAHLPDDYSSYLYLNLLGLSDEGQSQICHDLCRDDPAQVDRILGHIQSRPDLKSLCYVPITCIMIMMSLCNTNSLRSNVGTLTAILVYALDEWFLKKLKGDFQTRNVSELAYDGFLSNRFYFREHHLKCLKINLENTTTFLTTTIKFQLLQGKAVSYFAHLMWQEFFVAIKLRLYASKEEFQVIVPQLGFDKFEIVTRFLFGLCNKKTLDELLDCVDIEELNNTADREACQDILKKFAIESLLSYRDAERGELDTYFTSILPILGWVRETGDAEFTEQAAACLRNEVEINRKSPILASDVANLSHVLRARCSKLALTLLYPSFIGSCSQYFFHELSAVLVEKPYIQVSCPILVMEGFTKDLCIDEMWRHNVHLMHYFTVAMPCHLYGKAHFNCNRPYCCKGHLCDP